MLIYIAGGGKFGTKALTYFKNLHNYKVIVVDHDEHCLARMYSDVTSRDLDLKLLDNSKTYLVVSDAIEIFLKLVKLNIIPDITIPAIPKHFIGLLTYRYLTDFQNLKVYPDEDSLDKILSSRLSKFIISTSRKFGLVILSYMKDKLCLEDCLAPPICPVTGELREPPLLKVIEEELKKLFNDDIVVIESKQLGPGIGGIVKESIKQLIDKLKHVNNRIVVATACRCHAILNCFKISKFKQ